MPLAHEADDTVMGIVSRSQPSYHCETVEDWEGTWKAGPSSRILENWGEMEGEVKKGKILEGDEETAAPLPVSVPRCQTAAPSLYTPVPNFAVFSMPRPASANLRVPSRILNLPFPSHVLTFLL